MLSGFTIKQFCRVLFAVLPFVLAVTDAQARSVEPKYWFTTSLTTGGRLYSDSLDDVYAAFKTRIEADHKVYGGPPVI